MNDAPPETSAGTSASAACHASGTGPGVAPEGRIDWPLHRSLRFRGLIWGSVAGAALVLVYILVLGLTNSFQHVLDDFVQLWPWLTALVAGFALQVGLFVYLRAATRGGAGASSGGVMASSGTSAFSMVACCAHHLSDVLPLIGLAGAASSSLSTRTCSSCWACSPILSAWSTCSAGCAATVSSRATLPSCR